MQFTDFGFKIDQLQKRRLKKAYKVEQPDRREKSAGKKLTGKQMSEFGGFTRSKTDIVGEKRGGEDSYLSQGGRRTNGGKKTFIYDR